MNSLTLISLKNKSVAICQKKNNNVKNTSPNHARQRIFFIKTLSSLTVLKYKLGSSCFTTGQITRHKICTLS